MGVPAAKTLRIRATVPPAGPACRSVASPSVARTQRCKAWPSTGAATGRAPIDHSPITVDVGRSNPSPPSPKL